MLAELLQAQMQRRQIGSMRLAKLVNEQFGLHLHRNTVENWRTGAVKRTRDWRSLLAIAAVLHLSADQANALLVAANHASLSELHLRADEEDAPFFAHWKHSAPQTPDVETGEPLFDMSTPLVTITLTSGVRFLLHGKRTFGIGRTDIVQNWLPAVKLEDHGGVLAGVSRKHAAITLTEHAAFIEDYASNNGTKQNGKRLVPHRRYRLSDGDTLSFSRLIVKVQITA